MAEVSIDLNKKLQKEEVNKKKRRKAPLNIRDLTG